MFTKSLSQRMRHIRGSLKLKSLTLPGRTAAVPWKRLWLNVPNHSDSVDADESAVTDVDVTELKRDVFYR